MGCLHFLNKLTNLGLTGKNAGSDFVHLWVYQFWFDRGVAKTEKKWMQMLLSIPVLS